MPQPSALITGCSSGIGRALADTFKAAGYVVWATARKEHDLTALEQAGFHAVQLDVNDGDARHRLSASHGPIANRHDLRPIKAPPAPAAPRSGTRAGTAPR